MTITFDLFIHCDRYVCTYMHHFDTLDQRTPVPIRAQTNGNFCMQIFCDETLILFFDYLYVSGVIIKYDVYIRIIYVLTICMIEQCKLSQF